MNCVCVVVFVCACDGSMCVYAAIVNYCAMVHAGLCVLLCLYVVGCVRVLSVMVYGCMVCCLCLCCCLCACLVYVCACSGGGLC